MYAPSHPVRQFLTLGYLLALGACVAVDEPGDGRDDCATCIGGRADGFGIEEGSCDAQVVLQVANSASQVTLDIDASLNVRAADGIVAARPFDSLRALDDVPYVGPAAIRNLLDYGLAQGIACEDVAGECRRSMIDSTFAAPITGRDAVVVGDHAYLVGNQRLAAVSLQGDESTTLNSIELSSSSDHVTTDGTLLFMLGRSHLAIADPADGIPRLLGHLDLEDGRGVSVLGDSKLLVRTDDAILVVDYSESDFPFVQSTHAMPGHGTHILVDGSYAYALDSVNGIRVIDVSDPGALEAVGAIELPETIRDRTYGLALHRGTLFVAGYEFESRYFHWGQEVYYAHEVHTFELDGVSAEPGVVHRFTVPRGRSRAHLDRVGDNVWISVERSGRLLRFDARRPSESPEELAGNDMRPIAAYDGRVVAHKGSTLALLDPWSGMYATQPLPDGTRAATFMHYENGRHTCLAGWQS